MAGVMFIIWIPCEGYEQLLTNSYQEKKKTQQNVASSDEEDEETNEGNSKELKPQNLDSSMETCAISIESDSLNVSDKRRSRKRTRSTDDLTDLASELIHEGRLGENQGSMDSDKFSRLLKNRVRMKASEEAVDRFFSVKTEPPLDDSSSMEAIVREIIDKVKIKNSSWVRVNGGNSYQVTFSLENGVRCDDTIHHLSECGIGQREGSSIAIVPCTLYSEFQRAKEDEISSSMTKETGWNKFIGTVRARMNVAKIVDAVKADATITFDFTIVLIVASVIASFGLIENSTLFLAASMLISPLMGPILAATFGAVIKDRKLQYWGLKNEIIGIFMCIGVGFVFGLIVCGLHYKIGDELGLPSEMTARTALSSLVVGVCIALPSGAAVAIAVLGENFGSLVGVAISASLLPPAVNTGLLWSFSCIHMIFRDTYPIFETFVKEKNYSDTEALELLAMGFVSLCVTLTNVLCIYMTGCIFLKIKEVAPVTDSQRQFWKHDLKIARDFNRTNQDEEELKVEKELAVFKDTCDNFKGVGAELLRQNHNTYTNTWSPLTLRHHLKEVYCTRTSMRELDTLYTKLSGKNLATDRRSRLLPFARNSSPIHERLPEYSRRRHVTISTPSKSVPPEYILCGSAPLDVITETPKRIVHQTTLVSIDSQEAGPSGLNKKKFTVTPAHDPLRK